MAVNKQQTQKFHQFSSELQMTWQPCSKTETAAVEAQTIF
jgi:hypothetical protein